MTNTILGKAGQIFAMESLNDTIWEYDRSPVVQNGGLHNWIRNGKQDLTPDVLRDLYRKSSIHNSAINVKSNITAGGEIDFLPLESYYKINQDGDYELIEKNLTDSEKEAIVKQAKLFAKNAGSHTYINKAANQLHTYGGYYSFRNYAFNFRAELRLKSLYCESFRKCRISSKRTFVKDAFQPNMIYVSNDFQRASPSTARVYENSDSRQTNLFYMPFDDGTAIENGVNGMYGKLIGNFTEYRDYYPTADYETLDALNYIDLDYRLSEFDLNSVKNDFSLDFIVVRNRQPLEDDKKEAELKAKEKAFVKNKFKGEGGKRHMMAWIKPNTLDNGKVETYPPFEFIEVPKDFSPKRYNILREERLVKILNAHQIVTGEIIGLPSLSRTGFSSQAEFLMQAQEQLYFNVNKPAQDLICNDIQQLMIANGIPVKPVLRKNIANFRILTEQILKWAYGKNEARLKFGDAEMSEEVAKEVMNRIDNVQRSNMSASKE